MPLVKRDERPQASDQVGLLEFHWERTPPPRARGSAAAPRVGSQQPALRPLRIPGGHRPAAGGLPHRVQGRQRRVRAVGRLGDVAFEGAYRQIKIDEAASVRLTAVDGDVEVGRLNGPAEISTARGDIRITEALRGTVVLRTQSGDITVGVAAGVSAALDAGTGHGRISNALKNDGTAELDIRATTSDGDITARSL